MEAPPNWQRETYSSDYHAHGTPVILNTLSTGSTSISRNKKHEFRACFKNSIYLKIQTHTYPETLKH